MINIPKNEVKVKCRKCGRDAVASEFKMDIDAKMMVCPNCIREKSSPKNARVLPNTPIQMAMQMDKDKTPSSLGSSLSFSRSSSGLSSGASPHISSSSSSFQRSSSASNHAENENIEPLPQDTKPKPAGWDKDDELLEKLYSQKKKKVESFKPIPGSGTKLKYACQQCSYSFSYDAERKTPRSCPYCQRPVPDIF